MVLTLENLPNFIVVGAPKAGTTSLYYYLKQHPQIYLPSQKELHFFTYRILIEKSAGPGDESSLKKICSSLSEYCEYYRNVTDEKAIGEVSPSYLYHSGVSETILQTLGNIKIVICLRNPIDRAYSNYLHKLGNGFEPLTFKDALLAEDSRKAGGWGDFWLYSEHSLYYEKVKKYLSVFGDENVHFVLTENMKENMVRELEVLYEFLDVEQSFVADTSTIWNKSFYPKSMKAFQLFNRPSFLKDVIKHIIPSSVVQSMKKVGNVLNSSSTTEVKEEEFDYLYIVFKDDVNKLGRLMNHDFSFWLDKGKYYD
jgi:hypothetical protein